VGLLEFLSSLLNTVLVAAIPVLVGAFAQYFNLKTKNERINAYLGIATDAVHTAVDMVSQVYVEALKSDGSFDEDEQRRAFEMAKDIAKRVMGEAALQAIEQMSGDVGQRGDDQAVFAFVRGDYGEDGGRGRSGDQYEDGGYIRF
jgi:hypothetical protein